MVIAHELGQEITEDDVRWTVLVETCHAVTPWLHQKSGNFTISRLTTGPLGVKLRFCVS